MTALSTVAAAQYNGKLDSFIASYSTTKSTPNLTKLAIASMPKGRGRKGSKTPKRRLVTPIEHRAELTTVIPSQDEITTEDQTSQYNTTVSFEQ